LKGVKEVHSFSIKPVKNGGWILSLLGTVMKRMSVQPEGVENKQYYFDSLDKMFEVMKGFFDDNRDSISN